MPIKGRAEAHVIEILTEAAPLPYRAYLRKRGVILYSRGENGLDRQLAMEKLYRLFHIKMLLICGGGAADGPLQAGLVDELSLVLSPVTDGSSSTASVFCTVSGAGVQGSRWNFDLKKPCSRWAAAVSICAIWQRTQGRARKPAGVAITRRCKLKNQKEVLSEAAQC